MDLSFFLTSVAVAISSVLLFRKLFPQDSKENHSSTSSPPSSLSPSSSLSRNRKHHVFPSFHGADVRKAFLSHILKEFRSKGIDSFIDNNIERCKQIGPELIEAIRGSKIAIVVLSKNYTSSTWCMNELVEIMRCREVLGQTVMTIFYEVHPTDVKKQIGDFGEAFSKTCKGKSKNDIRRWEQALAEVATIAGEHSSNWDDDAAMIEKIANQISNKLNIAAPPHDFDRLIGMEAHMERMKPLLCLNSDDVRMIGIWGPSGIGKRTIARFLFHKHSSSFQLSADMVNIRESYPRACLDEYSAQLKLQNQMLSHIFNQKDIVVPRLEVAQERLQDKKVLLVLGDVNQLEQLDALAKETGWFGPGSRIIITTEDRRVFKAHGIKHIYKVGFPSIDEALQIFCMNAFDQKYPKDGFEELAREVTDRTGKLSLGLKVMGSHFKGMTKQQWSMELPRLRNNLNEKIESILKFSYDALCDEDKNLFLHIACFFTYERINKVEEYLEKKFKNVRQGLNVLADKSLIYIGDERINMDKLLSQLGRDIVRHEPGYKSILEPGQRQFLHDTEEICELLTDNAADSRSVIGIDFDFGRMKKKKNISERAFKGRYNLQFLRFHGFHDKLKLSSGLDNLSGKVRLLHWDNFPMKRMPSNVNLEFLVELNMQYSKLEKLWEEIKPLRNLRRMNLGHSVNLKELPDLSTCSSLTKLPSSIGNTTSLRDLNLKGCSSLTKLPSSIGEITNLKELYLEGCSSLVELPSSIGNFTNLEILNLSNCLSLVEIPLSIGGATNLKELTLWDCYSIVTIPSSIGKFTNLKNLSLRGCKNLVEIPTSIGNAINLEILDICHCKNLVEIPSSIGNLQKLRNLRLQSCSKIEALPVDINLESLFELDVSDCSSLVELPSFVGNATNLKKLNLIGCSSLVELPSSIGRNLHKEGNLSLRECSKVKALPININFESLGEIDLSGCSSLVELPFSIGDAMNLENLRLEGCSSLVELPSSIGNVTNLKILDLSNCSSLVKLPFSVRNLHKLWHLRLKGCSNLVELPININFKSLTSLDLTDCSSMVKIPSTIWNATNLYTLILDGCSSLVELPSIENLHTLSLKGCSNIEALLSTIGNATNLKELNLGGCSSLVELPSSIGNLHQLSYLSLKGCSSLVELPSSIGNLHQLWDLNLEGCSNLVELPSSIGNLHGLRNLNLKGCSNLVELPININLKCLYTLDLTDCSLLKSFPEISTSIMELELVGTSIEEVPLSIRSWSNLCKLRMSYSENLKEFPHVFDRITELHLSDKGIQEIGPWV